MSACKSSDLTLCRRLWLEARPYWLHIVGIFLLNLLSTPLALLTPLALKIAVDSVIGTHPVPGFLAAILPAAAMRSDTAVLLVAVGLVVAVALLEQLQSLGSWLLSTYTGEKLILAFRALLFRHAQRLSLSEHDSKGTFDAIYRINYDAPTIQWVVIDGIIPLLTMSCTLLAMIYVTARINLQLALVALVVVPILFWLTEIYRPRLRREWGELWTLRSAALSVVQEALSALRVVKAFGQEDREQERLIRRSDESVRVQIRVAIRQGWFNLLVGLTMAGGTASVLFVGVRHIQADALTLGELLIVMTYLVRLYDPMRTIGERVAKLQSAFACAERAFSLLDAAPEVKERLNGRRIARASGAITFRHVSFAYHGEHTVLHDLSFEIDAGTRLGIAGPSGAGKSTLVSLLLRFYDPTTGHIYLDGIDLRDYKLSDLRNQFAMVLQEPVLFSTSIAENISYSRPGADAQDIVAAAKAANVHEFICGLPHGYDTLVGERGMRLSGGERQRIGLARAFLKDAPLLILDEPTSSVDMQTEMGIMEAMERLMRSRTTIMIAHRLSTLQRSDVLLVIEDGRLMKLTSEVSTAIKEMRTFGQTDAVPIR